MKAIHNAYPFALGRCRVVLYPKDTEKWKQFTTEQQNLKINKKLFCIPKILKNESNSQPSWFYCHAYLELFCIPKILKNESNSQQQESIYLKKNRCFVSQRYWKMKAIHNNWNKFNEWLKVVLYPKDTEKWKQFTTGFSKLYIYF